MVRPLVVKTEKFHKHRFEVTIYYKNKLGQIKERMMEISNFDGDLEIFNNEQEHEVFLCLHCKTPVRPDLPNGHIHLKDAMFLCPMCASSSEIFHKYIDYDKEGQYIVKEA